MRNTIALLGLLAVTTGCRQGAAHADAAAAGEQAAVIDSVFPMDVMIERFQAALPRVDALDDGAADSRDELVRRFAAVLEDSSAAELRHLRLDAAEFAYLYFPTAVHARRPYELHPAIAWLLTEQNGLKGETRLLRYYGGRPLRLAGYACEPEPRLEGENRIWEECRLRLRRPDHPHGRDGLAEERLFGSIIERGGRFKFVSIANRL